MHALFDEWQLLAAQLGRACVAHGSVIAGAESCTGGLVAAVLTSVSGSPEFDTNSQILTILRNRIQ